jgi:hypothetical protein
MEMIAAVKRGVFPRWKGRAAQRFIGIQTLRRNPGFAVRALLNSRANPGFCT